MNLLRSASLLALASLALSAHAAFYDFESVPENTTTPFSIESEGLTASFGSAPQGGFTVSDVSGLGFTGLTGHALFATDTNDSTLGILFSSPLTAFSTVFATPTTQALELNAYLGATLVGTVVVTGVAPGGQGFPEGQIGFSGTLFDGVTIRSQDANGAFVVDNITARPVPEPVTMAALGLGAVATLRRRKRA